MGNDLSFQNCVVCVVLRKQPEEHDVRYLKARIWDHVGRFCEHRNNGDGYADSDLFTASCNIFSAPTIKTLSEAHSIGLHVLNGETLDNSQPTERRQKPNTMSDHATDQSRASFDIEKDYFYSQPVPDVTGMIMQIPYFLTLQGLGKDIGTGVYSVQADFTKRDIICEHAGDMSLSFHNLLADASSKVQEESGPGQSCILIEGVFPMAKLGIDHDSIRRLKEDYEREELVMPDKLGRNRRAFKQYAEEKAKADPRLMVEAIILGFSFKFKVTVTQTGTARRTEAIAGGADVGPTCVKARLNCNTAEARASRKITIEDQGHMGIEVSKIISVGRNDPEKVLEEVNAAIEQTKQQPGSWDVLFMETNAKTLFDEIAKHTKEGRILEQMTKVFPVEDPEFRRILQDLGLEAYVPRIVSDFWFPYENKWCLSREAVKTWWLDFQYLQDDPTKPRVRSYTKDSSHGSIDSGEMQQPAQLQQPKEYKQALVDGSGSGSSCDIKKAKSATSIAAHHKVKGWRVIVKNEKLAGKCMMDPEMSIPQGVTITRIDPDDGSSPITRPDGFSTLGNGDVVYMSCAGMAEARTIDEKKESQSWKFAKRLGSLERDPELSDVVFFNCIEARSRVPARDHKKILGGQFNLDQIPIETQQKLGISGCANMRGTINLSVCGIVKTGGNVIWFPKPDTVLHKDDRLFIFDEVDTNEIFCRSKTTPP